MEKRQFNKAVKSLEFYKVDPKIIVDDDDKRISKDGEEKGYTELVGLYRKASAKRAKSDKIKNTSPIKHTFRYDDY